MNGQLTTGDPKTWACEFVSASEQNPAIATDVVAMAGWFAAAMAAHEHQLLVDEYGHNPALSIKWAHNDTDERSTPEAQHEQVLCSDVGRCCRIGLLHESA